MGSFPRWLSEFSKTRGARQSIVALSDYGRPAERAGFSDLPVSSNALEQAHRQTRPAMGEEWIRKNIANALSQTEDH